MKKSRAAGILFGLLLCLFSTSQARVQEPPFSLPNPPNAVAFPLPASLPTPPVTVSFPLPVDFPKPLVTSAPPVINGTRPGPSRSEARLTPAQLAFLQNLEADQTIKNLESVAVFQLKPRNPEEAATCRRNNAIKLALMRAAKTGKSTLKAKVISGTDEGTSVIQYLMVQNGEIEFVSDSTLDRFGGLSFGVLKVKRLQLGHFVWKGEKLEFVPLKGKPPSDVFLFIKCFPGSTLYF